MMQSSNVAGWLNISLAEMSGSMVTAPGREDIEIPLNEQLIVEYYSR
jgi:small subunit ribosomal protein S4